MDVLQELSQSLLNLNSGHTLPVVLQRMLAQKIRELNALTAINRTIASCLDREILLSRIAVEAKNLLALDGVLIRLVDGSRLVRAAHAGSGEQARASVEADTEESLSATAVRENRTLAVKQVSADPQLTAGYRERLNRLGCRSVICLPLRVGGRAIGAIVGLSMKEREFHPDEVGLITALADQAAIAVEKSLLVGETKAKSDEITRMGKEFEEMRHAKAKFISAVSHELRTPLQVIIGYADLLKEGIVGESKDEQHRVLNTILQNAEILDRLIGNVLAITKAEVNKTALDISRVEIADVMDHILRFTRRVDPSARLKILFATPSNLPPISTDVAKLDAILQNLVGNAYKFTPEGGIEVRVVDLRDRSRLEFSVADTGIGIEESERERIFAEFYQGKQAQAINRSGVGLGLSIVKKYLPLMQGEIRVDSRRGKGTTFTFTLPYSIP
ncbi:MAG: ATP-binding protein [Candidatus Binatia bacterium]